MGKRDELAAQATGYALDHGLIGLSLRPLAAALGTSDRMLIYHFGSKDALVAAVLETSCEISVRTIRELPASPSVRQAVLDLWEAFEAPQLLRCQRLYVEAAALGLFGREPYATSVRASNDVWLAEMVAHLRRSGADDRAERLAVLVDAAFNGILLDQPLDDARESRRIVEDLADALA
ncbi:MAG: TetR/AcrR family transcriptional regulator [Aeromicrobium sp.]